MAIESGRSVLITGASSGIGAALALQWAKPGWKIALVARRADRLEALADQVRAKGAQALALPFDLSRPESLAPVVEGTVEAFGGLDVLVNNAGLGLARAYADSSVEDLRFQIEVNVTVPIVLTRLALPHLLASRGTVINVGSSIVAIEVPLMGAYGATKAALAYWNDALRRELIHTGVKVCLVEPGPITTEFRAAMSTGGREAEVLTPPKFVTATAEEVARRIARLVDRPQRRISPLRRLTWPWRWVGAALKAVPPLGDRLVNRGVRNMAGPPGD